ncbi:Flavodoxin [Petrocella atlantisensis]|uniref:Flavodoxin n=1 Tax=Petrocella atlantisensis TaxID=2173034 RepID=A0A3P7P0I4_9FIRM|nr:flavodoxin [Petrocella atlantisensis]MCF8020739.1 flavodoxin [Vallitaleaceae bacterium]VDN48705.1 Flavodoxin [Petrocella atlantisensis]
MRKITIIYWSGTGNTQMMAEALFEGAKEVADQVKLLSVEDATVDDVLDAEVIALGCSSMGNEVLDPDEMEPFVESIEEAVKDKKVFLFGSYGWGDGEWMRDWEKRMVTYGCELIEEGLIINEAPDEGGLEQCRDYGRQLGQ